MRYRFGDCCFDPTRGMLQWAGALVHCEPKALVVLQYLLGHRDASLSSPLAPLVSKLQQSDNDGLKMLATVYDKAWNNASYKARLKDNPRQALSEVTGRPYFLPYGNCVFM